MQNLESELITQTTTELLEDAIEGIKHKIAKLHIAAYQEQSNRTGKVIAAQSEIIQNAINTLKGIKETL